MPLPVSQRRGGWPALAVIVALCLPSLAFMAAMCQEVVLRLLGRELPRASEHAIVLIVHFVTFPWAFILACCFGLWVQWGASARVRAWTWGILAVSLPPNLVMWSQRHWV
jgi:hypothetical protein